MPLTRLLRAMRQKTNRTIIRGGQINAMGQREELGLSWKALLYVIAIGARRTTVIAGEKQALPDRSPVGSEGTFVLPDLAGWPTPRCGIATEQPQAAFRCKGGGSPFVSRSLKQL